MTKQIKYDRQCNFTGRNGYFKQSGIEIMNVSDDKIMLIPLDSRGQSARCDIEIPRENIVELVAKLLAFYNEKNDVKVKTTISL